MDQYQRALRLRMGLWSLPGAVLGAIGGMAAGHALLGAVIGGAVVFGFQLLVVGGAGRAVGAIHAPSGRTTPRDEEFSGAEALAISGRYEDAVSAFELALAEDPAAPAPYLRIARIYRDDLERLEDSARWFRRALADASMSAAQNGLTRRELIELYVYRMKEPRRAAPELARMAEEMKGTPDGQWAARLLKSVKADMAEPADGA